MFHNESFLKRFFRKMESRNYINGYLENVAQCVIKKKKGELCLWCDMQTNMDGAAITT